MFFKLLFLTIVLSLHSVASCGDSLFIHQLSTLNEKKCKKASPKKLIRMAEDGPANVSIPASWLRTRKVTESKLLSDVTVRRSVSYDVATLRAFILTVKEKLPHSCPRSWIRTLGTARLYSNGYTTFNFDKHSPYRLSPEQYYCKKDYQLGTLEDGSVVSIITEEEVFALPPPVRSCFDIELMNRFSFHRAGDKQILFIHSGAPFGTLFVLSEKVDRESGMKSLNVEWQKDVALIPAGGYSGTDVMWSEISSSDDNGFALFYANTEGLGVICFEVDGSAKLSFRTAGWP